MWRAGGLVVHRCIDFLLCEFYFGATALLPTLPHKGSFICGFVGAGAVGGSEDLVQTLGCNFENTGFENLSPIMLWEVSKSRAIDHRTCHGRRCCGRQ